MNQFRVFTPDRVSIHAQNVERYSAIEHQFELSEGFNYFAARHLPRDLGSCISDSSGFHLLFEVIQVALLGTSSQSGLRYGGFPRWYGRPSAVAPNAHLEFGLLKVEHGILAPAGHLLYESPVLAY